MCVTSLLLAFDFDVDVGDAVALFFGLVAADHFCEGVEDLGGGLHLASLHCGVEQLVAHREDAARHVLAFQFEVLVVEGLDSLPVAPGAGNANLLSFGVVEYELAAGESFELAFVETLDAIFYFGCGFFGAKCAARLTNRAFVEIIFVANTLTVLDFVLFLF